ncbi:MAG: UDP-N-acetylmuramoyl-L-alanyl-D-glutamate--2,6-diaminopimelate ligase [Erysipelotrichaceae bacterium]|nr:UDP-N-acetylmuramoyl-L-alanyl-D-glutamate--2,6-diaminopimelate ligase [Erysipelotrichaceae bacterium]
MKKLRELLPIDSDIAIESIHSDSRCIKPNSIFFCLDGLSVDGHQFIEEAIYRGAKCIVHTKEVNYSFQDVIFFQTTNIIARLNEVACKFYDYPSQRLKMIGVTGTNGKTIVSTLIYQSLNQFMPFGYIGTRHVLFNDQFISYMYTTPEVIFLQEHLNKMVNANIQGACLEVSSHGLSLGRVQGVDFDIAVFTNLSPDHLDFHGNMEDYIQAKLKLFSMMKPGGVAIINRDDELMYHKISSVTKARVYSYGIKNPAYLRAFDVQLNIDHTSFKIMYEEKTYTLKTKLLGEFNIYHILASILTLLQFNLSIEVCIQTIEKIGTIEGRLEAIKNKHHLNIFVDNGHTPVHYQEVFSFASKVSNQGRIIAVFGCVGKREFKKRFEIGQIADRYCDHIILTEEDCRDEDPEKICKEIQEGIKKATCIVVTDRETAIYQAVETANPEDIILIIGKGDEKTMIRKDGVEPYIGDEQAVMNAINEIYCEDDFNEFE